MSNFRTIDRQTGYLLPPSVDEWLPEKHLARFVVEVIDGLRLGIVGQDDEDEIVQGIVLMRRDAQSLPTIRAIEAEVDKINSSSILPPGVRIEGIYDRSGLINLTTSTVLHNLLLGLALIFAVQLIFLGNLRSAVIVAATIPFALSFAVGIMVLRGELANLLSVGAIDFGLVVGASVIMVENIFRHLSGGARLRPDHMRRLAEAERAGFRRTCYDPRRGPGGGPFDLFLRGDHRRRLPAALYAPGH